MKTENKAKRIINIEHIFIKNPKNIRLNPKLFFLYIGRNLIYKSKS